MEAAAIGAAGTRAIRKQSQPPNIDPRAAVFLELLSGRPPTELVFVLSSCGLPRPPPLVVEQVLRELYGSPAAAICFFRWIGTKTSVRAWNLMVDILGKSSLFEEMWDAVRSMRQQPGLLSSATFASIFSSYCSVGQFKEAKMAFRLMPAYGLPRDAIAVNTLLSAMCRQRGGTPQAVDYLDGPEAKNDDVNLDGDSFAILLEGWKREGNTVRAKNTFGKMVVNFGWQPENVVAYDAVLSTLVAGGEITEAFNFLQLMKNKGCLPSSKFFSYAIDLLIHNGQFAQANSFWQIMVDSGLIPNLSLYNSIITLCCATADFDMAFHLLDDMPFNGVFPNATTYNNILNCLVSHRRHSQAEAFLSEMLKNEHLPSPETAAAAISLFFEEFNTLAAFEVWRCVVDERIRPAEDCAKKLFTGLCNLNRISELCRYAEEAINAGINIDSSLQTLKTALSKARRLDDFDRIAKRVKQQQTTKVETVGGVIVDGQK